MAANIKKGDRVKWTRNDDRAKVEGMLGATVFGTVTGFSGTGNMRIADVTPEFKTKFDFFRISVNKLSPA